MRVAAVWAVWVAGTAAASPIDLQLVPSAVQGQGKPAIVVVAHRATANVAIHLKRDGCGAAREVARSLGKLAAGETHRFELDQPPGQCRYEGELTATIDGQAAMLPLSFTTELSGPPVVTALPNGLDRETHTVHVTFNHEADHGAVEAFGEDGKSFGAIDNQALGDAKPGDPLALSYEDGDGGVVLRLRVTVTDGTGVFAAVDLFPWSLTIPHQEVVFANGSAEIAASERPKLDDSLRQIKAAIAKVAGQVPVRLFVAGYTDTVGAADANQQLSLARARSLAAFFAQGGVRVPMLVAGLGEDALAVATPDETPEPRNRRAEYILAVDPAVIAGAARAVSWSAVK